MHVVFIIVENNKIASKCWCSSMLLELIQQNIETESLESGNAMQWKLFSEQQMSNIFIRIGCV